jgi:hypothetical protein
LVLWSWNFHHKYHVEMAQTMHAYMDKWINKPKKQTKLIIIRKKKRTMSRSVPKQQRYSSGNLLRKADLWAEAEPHLTAGHKKALPGANKDLPWVVYHPSSPSLWAPH